MKITEIIQETKYLNFDKIPPSTLWAEQTEDLRLELVKNPELFENSADYQNLQSFLSMYKNNDPNIGDKYVYSSILSIPPARILSLAHFRKPHKLLGIKNNQVFFEINNQIEPFPKKGAESNDMLRTIIMFSSLEDFEEFQIMFLLKFSDWTHNTKILD